MSFPRCGYQSFFTFGVEAFGVGAFGVGAFGAGVGCNDDAAMMIMAGGDNNKR